jgi:XTP/dITP diphosphohydrolase
VTSLPPVLIATANAGKLRELAAMLPGLTLLSLRDVRPMDLDEPGEDYVTNAVAKAIAASRATGHVTLADDSGLEVDALGGAPGWRSARYAGGHGDDRANRARLLAAMARVPPGSRRARFRCTVAVADTAGPLGERVLLGFGECEGAIALAERGAGGFGFDPLLEVKGFTSTMAELDEDTKNRISHRARAVAAVLPALRAYLAAR